MITFLGFHLKTSGILYLSASCAIRVFSVILVLAFCVRPPNPSRAGCVKGIRPYLSGVGGGGDVFKDLLIKMRDSCISTILLPVPMFGLAVNS